MTGTVPVIPIGGSATTQDNYTGANGEVSVDLSNRGLRVHDGVTKGGTKHSSDEILSQTFQVKNAELDGFAFAPGAKGFMVRVATGSYTLRGLSGTAGQIDVANGDGVNGSPTVSLPDTITKAMTFSAGLTASGFIGPLSGNVTGNVAGNTNGVHTGATNGTHTGPQVGNVDVRGATLQLDDAQIPLLAIDQLEELLARLLMPVGCIVMWSGSMTAVPEGWKLCNGTDGTPNLEDRFIRCAATPDQQGTIGGSTTHVHTATIAAGGNHSHTATIAGTALNLTQIPAHNHGNGVGDSYADRVFVYGSKAAVPITGYNVDGNSPDGIYQGLTETVGGGQTHTHSATVGDSGDHVHGATVAAATVIPPYYAVAFIIKVAEEI